MNVLAYFDLHLAVMSLQLGAGLVMAITALETLVRFRVYATSGILSWDLGRRASNLAQRPLLRRMADFFYQENRFKALFAIRLGLGLGLVASSLFAFLSAPLILIALLSSLLVIYRAGPGHDGSFQLRLIILFVLFTCSISPQDSLAFQIGLYFLSAQLVLSYFLAGIAKLRGATWRDGSGLIGVLGTVYHGVKWAHRLLAKRPWLSQVLSWFVIAFEVLFPLVLVGQGGLVVVLLAVSTLFHLSTSFLMGLNGFFLSFVAGYPTLVYCLGQLPWADW